ncbi:hypothetical protein HHK36_023239 [Tetracentron sinense]|uniref:Ubiquitin-like protease family profile domain-containing protein n=1 Tax=Tetracentron sinense TaxID=13715 RepID=A0A834YL57_TETSI|nr:hypothetical protein HHK36_023239 [Tetracentron sinense]
MSDRLARVEAWMGSQSSQPPPTECHEGTPSKYPSYACIQTPVQPSIGEAPPSVTKRPRRNIISSDILHSSSVNIDVPIGKKVDRTGLKIDPLRALDKKSIEVVKHFSLEKDKGSHIDAYMSLLKNRHEKYSYPQSCVFGMVWFMESLVADSTNFHKFSVDPKNYNKSTSEIAKEFKWNSNNLVVASGEKGHLVMWMADRIYLPFNWNNLHWALAVLDPKKRTVYILDSMNFDPWEKYQIQLKAMVEILPSLFHATGDVEAIYGDKWEIKEVSCPKQENNGMNDWLMRLTGFINVYLGFRHACGIYVLKFVDYLCSELPLDFTQANINYFRRRITLELFEQEAKP